MEPIRETLARLKRNQESTQRDTTPQPSPESELEARREDRFRASGVPELHAGQVVYRGFAAIHERDGSLRPAISACQKFAADSKPQSVFIHGGVGCGKTLLAVATIRDIYFTSWIGYVDSEGKATWGNGRFWHDGPNARFIAVPNLLMRLRSTFNDGSQIHLDDLIKFYSTCPILILDDIGAENVTGWVSEQLFMLVNERYNRGLPTLFTSNLSVGELANKVSERVADRILEMCRGAIIQIKAGSFR